MIRVFDGKRYDTEKATEVYSWWNGQSTSDFGYRTKTLYQTSKGSWFLHHEGGAMTDMAVSVGNNGMGGSATIEPVSEDDAFGFLQSRNDKESVEAIEKHFSDRVEDA